MTNNGNFINFYCSSVIVFVMVSRRICLTLPPPQTQPDSTYVDPPWANFEPSRPPTSDPSGIVPPWGGINFQPRSPPTSDPSGVVPPWGGVNFRPRDPPPPGLRPLSPLPPPRGTIDFAAAPPPPEDADIPPRRVGLDTCFRPFEQAADPTKLTFLDLINAVDGGVRDEGAPAVEYTLKQGVDPNQMPYDLRTGESVLSHAVFCNKAEIVRILLKYGADPNRARVSDGTTPLHFAAWRDSVDMIKMLVDAGANVTAVDEENHDVFQRALCMHSLKAAEYMASILGTQICARTGGRTAYWSPGTTDFGHQDMCYRIHRYYEHDLFG